MKKLYSPFASAVPRCYDSFFANVRAFHLKSGNSRKIKAKLKPKFTKKHFDTNWNKMEEKGRKRSGGRKLTNRGSINNLRRCCVTYCCPRRDLQMGNDPTFAFSTDRSQRQGPATNWPTCSVLLMLEQLQDLEMFGVALVRFSFE